ncbi:DMT family transporter [Ascidiimonas sp. W6]|uniref:DMT family transporter n=1 Tax=Ascidiimonas meishanensis TaxID=3128903 RepID=UPI0030EBEBD2
MDKRTLAILAAFGASAIYALNHVIAKDVMPLFIKPFGFILLRVTGAFLLFLIISFWGPREKIAKKDWLRLILCAIFGMVINMLFFFKGLSLSTPINSAVIITISPIILLILSAIWIKERITFIKIIGVLVGLAGALTLVLFGAEIREDAPNIPLGNMLFLVNATSYSIYLIMVRPLTTKYHTFTLMKWLFLIAVVINFPITIGEFSEVNWKELPFEAIWKMTFVVVGTTFLTYLLNLFALKELPATTIGTFIYLQPLLTIIFAAFLGADALNSVKIVAAILVFTGVYMVTKKEKSQVNHKIGN